MSRFGWTMMCFARSSHRPATRQARCCSSITAPHLCRLANSATSVFFIDVSLHSPSTNIRLRFSCLGALSTRRRSDLPLAGHRFAVRSARGKVVGPHTGGIGKIGSVNRGSDPVGRDPKSRKLKYRFRSLLFPSTKLASTQGSCWGGGEGICRLNSTHSFAVYCDQRMK